jgi:hypothetical protein
MSSPTPLVTAQRLGSARSASRFTKAATLGAKSLSDAWKEVVLPPRVTWTSY